MTVFLKPKNQTLIPVPVLSILNNQPYTVIKIFQQKWILKILHNRYLIKIKSNLFNS